MNQKFDVVWSNIAENDLKNIVDYIADDSPPNALKIFKRIKQKASSLYTFPERGRIDPGTTGSRDTSISGIGHIAVENPI